ncbi:FxsB family cyclophane-forming radical SAM/SPASM peptide maturase [Dactylosporangium sp. AC04546]|uniref:FxsB family cyclophane-forming radical SAM/SPASM peptide maturase n=1 Tax=Dactylosporangium sp. AC04546 TaxID=2862460 RepID=UPI001EDCC5A6|nr:FxsB family cyclophane-forming radical SAM/SPASM peptide maturase [Dactylosporangium sp. AC04546]WVK84142.1 FxsB family cyclophane-forming radical SAM/SPASM peptide maturase [Dactylosporangium sp. AC04546]
MYEHPDQGWRRQPITMAPTTASQVAGRIAEHAAEHRLGSVRVILHGGEPLLAGADGLRAVAIELRRRIDPVTRLELGMQSNGLLLTPQICDVLVEQRVRVGISLDGDKAANDRHRRYANGNSSHAKVLEALALLRRDKYREVYGGILCTVDIDNDPIAVYEALRAEQPPHVDFLLPHANWDRPPDRKDSRTPHADWLLRIHRRWIADGRPMPIRLFDAMSGGPSHTEAVGLGRADLVVIESDGTFEQVDSLKSAFDGAAATGLDVFRNSVNDAADHPMIAIRQTGLTGLSATCRACAIVHQCGGGQFTHRYRTGSGFDNPSVYCADLQELIAAMPPPPNDRLAGTVLDDLGTGAGEPASIDQLVAVNEGMIRAQLRDLSRFVDPVPLAAEGWDLLARLDEESPEAVRAVLAHPFVRSWAARCRTSRDADDLARFAGVAAAAAIHAGADARITVPVHKGRVSLPGIGAFQVEDTEQAALVIVGGEFELHTTRQRWQPARYLGTVLLEDTDPGRDCFDGLELADRLDDGEVKRWQDLLDGALDIIDTTAYGPGVRGTLRAIVPLRPDADRERSAAARDAFGAVAVAPVADPAALSVLLVHEVQHLKLGAVLDVTDLFVRDDPHTVRVPWREDPRPVEGVLQGTYAFVAVADMWRARPGPEADRYRTWASGAVDALLEGDALTPAGRRFVERLRTTLDSW